jgi:two-component system OmpR family response regulator
VLSPFSRAPVASDIADAAGCVRFELDVQMSQSLLIVEDEASIREPLVKYFVTHQFRVKAAANAVEARTMLAAHTFDLVIADIMMPGEDGLSLCRHICATSNLPVILLTARAEELDRILGLEVGADDYVTKPFSPRELLARVKAVIRRANSLPPRQATPETTTYAFGNWLLKTGQRELVDLDGVTVPLSSGEYSLLLALIERPRLVLNRDQLLDLTQGREATLFDRSIDNQISRLRRKIEEDPKTPKFIKTVWGGGYSFAAEVRKL